MSEFMWHKTADKLPEFGEGRWLLLGNGGGMYVSSRYQGISALRTAFYVPNRRDNYMYSEQVKAWAEIPPYKEDV